MGIDEFFKNRHFKAVRVLVTPELSPVFRKNLLKTTNLHKEI